MNEKDDNQNDEVIEMGSIKENNSMITQENKPYNLSSTSNEVQNIFKKIRKKNKETEIKKNPNDFGNEESKDILSNNDQDKKAPKEDIDVKRHIEVIVLLISFICFYFSFFPITDYYSPISFFIIPMDLFSFILCLISSIITAGFISLVILQKMSGFYIFYMILYYMIIFFLNHYKFIGSSHFDQSISVFYVFASTLIHSLCLYFILYFFLKHYYYEGFIKKDNFFIKSFVSRWHSSEKIKRSENLLNEQNKNFMFSNKKGNKIQLYLIIFGLLSLEIANIILILLKKGEIFTCESWEIGINGTKINDINNKCKILNPKGYCYMEYFKGYFELSTKEDKICSLRDSTVEKKNFLKNLEDKNKNINLFQTKIFAFPLTNIDEKYSLKNIKNFGLSVNKDIYDYSKTPNKEPKPEALLDFSDDNKFQGKFAELKINLNFNKTLSDQRKLLENENSLFDNVLVINLQSTSRAHFQRSFPKLSNFIKNFMEYSPLNEKKMEAYQFMKYHSFSASSKNNIIPMFYGSSLKSNKGISHIRYFKENGFVTGQEIDMCRKELYPMKLSKKDNKEYEEWDHENVAYLCDGNYFEINNDFPDDRGASSFKERCLYGNPVSSYMINYAKQFWEKYSQNKKYFRMAFNYGYEKTGEVISYLDEVLYDFLFEYYDKGYLDNSALFIVSDHGNQKEGIYNIISNYEFEMEKKLGTFILILNRKKGFEKYETNLLNNQQILMTPYDIHDTLIHIVYGDNNIDEIKTKFSVNYKGNSVLLEINGNERSCKKYDDWIDNSFCCCLSN